VNGSLGKGHQLLDPISRKRVSSKQIRHPAKTSKRVHNAHVRGLRRDMSRLGLDARLELSKRIRKAMG